MTQADARFDVQATSSGPRWCCDSFIRIKHGAIDVTLATSIKIPVMPHM
jgi:hypothetical protein